MTTTVNNSLVGSLSLTSEGSVRLPVGKAADALEALKNKDHSDILILERVTKSFPDAEVKTLENGQRAFVSTGVRNSNFKLRFILGTQTQGQFYLRKVVEIKVKLKGEMKVIEVWSQESALVDRAKALDLLNELAGKTNTTKLSAAFKAVLD